MKEEKINLVEEWDKTFPKSENVNHRNVKYPEAIELQKRLLEEEGRTILTKGTKNIKYYVKDFENSLIEL